MAPYRSTKDTAKFLYRNPIPYDLIGQLVTLLVQRRDQLD